MQAFLGCAEPGSLRAPIGCFPESTMSVLGKSVRVSYSVAWFFRDFTTGNGVFGDHGNMGELEKAIGREDGLVTKGESL